MTSFSYLPSKIPLTVIILTHNSQDTIEQCIQSVLFANQIVIADDYSTDDTLNIIKKFQRVSTFDVQFSVPEIVVVQVRTNQDFAKARNKAKKQAKGSWILYVDSDEVVSTQLKQEIETIVNDTSNKHNGFLVKRQDFLFGKQLRFGETRAVWLLRLGRRMNGTDSVGKWIHTVHEEWVLPKPHGKLQNPLIHTRDIRQADFFTRLDAYSSLKAKELYQQQVIESFWTMLYKPLGKFLYNYFWRLGILDGFAGFTIAFWMSWHSLLVRVKLRLLYMSEGKNVFPMPKP
jgi:glycosyltransferase involved in cell wall biosynthesis